MAKNVLSVNKIVKRYPNFLLNQISLNLEEGTITGFIGKNGAGKSTTLKAIMGLIKIESGTIKFDMHKVENTYPIGYLGMEKGIYPDESLENIARFVAKAWGRSWNEKEYRYYAEKVFGLCTTQKMKELSTGMVIKFLLSLKELKPEDREIFTKYYYECMKIEEIAEELQMNPQTIKTRLRRGRETLKQILLKEGYRSSEIEN